MRTDYEPMHGSMLSDDKYNMEDVEADDLDFDSTQFELSDSESVLAVDDDLAEEVSIFIVIES